MLKQKALLKCWIETCLRKQNIEKSNSVKIEVIGSLYIFYITHPITHKRIINIKKLTFFQNHNKEISFSICLCLYFFVKRLLSLCLLAFHKNHQLFLIYSFFYFNNATKVSTLFSIIDLGRKASYLFSPS